MNDTIETPPYHDDLGRLLSALRLTESLTGFGARLIEKDYYCSIVLRDFAVLFKRDWRSRAARASARCTRSFSG